MKVIGQILGMDIIEDPYMIPKELWLIKQGKSSVVHLHEGPRAGEEIEVVLKKVKMIRIIDIPELEWPCKELS